MKTQENNYFYSQHNKKEQSKIRLQEKKSKLTNYEIDRRVTRRMKKIMSQNSITEDSSEKCIICLSNFQGQCALLSCGHKYCVKCFLKWWVNHPNCPFCRKEIGKVKTSLGRELFYENIFDEIEQENRNFIPHCELCWAEIDENQDLRICTICRSVYWHNRCLPFSQIKWFCVECADISPDEENEEKLEQ